MNCYQHPDSVSVATCACGRAMCAPCAAKRQPPMCDPCHAASVAERIASVQKRLAINAVFSLAYLVLGVGHLFGALDHSKSPIIGIAYIVAGIWGFIGFRWLLDGLMRVTGLAIFAGLQSWLWAYFIGSAVCSFAGFVVLPVLIGLEWLELKGLRAEQPPAAAPLAVADGRGRGMSGRRMRRGEIEIVVRGGAAGVMARAAKVLVGVVLLLMLFGAEMRLHFGMRLGSIVPLLALWLFWCFALRRADREYSVCRG
jgi:hypothetical protein